MQQRMPDRAANGAVTHGRTRRDSAGRHIRGGRHGVSALDADSILELQRLAGNAAVAKRLLGQKRDGRVILGVDAVKVGQFPSPPAAGLKSIRDLKKGAGILGYTIREVDDWTPILMPETPRKTDKGWTTKAFPIDQVPEPRFTEYWPTAGRHKLSEHNYVDVTGDWEARIKGGEDEHVGDATLAWELTWKKAAEIINALAKKPGPPAATPEAAEKALWDRYRKALPEEDMRPGGDRPTTAAQRAIFSPDRGSLFRWLFETTVVRDTRGYHEPKMSPKGVGKDTVSEMVDGDSKLPGPESPDLLKEVRVKWKPGKDIIGT